MEERKALWNDQQTYLREILMKPDRVEEAKELCLKQHALVHCSEMSNSPVATFEDELWEGLEEDAFRSAAGVKGRTVAYGMWHSSRIEDITMNILVADRPQVIDENNWQAKINASIYDTGNELSPEEIAAFSATIQLQELRNYRIAVGRRTREIIAGLQQTDFKKKFQTEKLEHIFEIGAVSKDPAACWLVDFWGKKNVAGILLMPATRHHMVHINESMTAKKKGMRGR